MVWLVLLLSYLAVSILIRQNGKLAESLDRNAHKLLGTVLAPACFFLVFLTLVYRFIVGYELNALLAFIALFTVRQMTQRLEQLLGDAIYLHRRKENIISLFLYGKGYHPKSFVQPNSAWSIVSQNGFNQSQVEILRRFRIEFQQASILSWHYLGTPDILCYSVETAASDGTTNYYLVKVYSNTRKHIADREVPLYESD